MCPVLIFLCLNEITVPLSSTLQDREVQINSPVILPFSICLTGNTNGYLSADQLSHTCFGTSLESAHLLDPLLWGRVGAQGTNLTRNGHGQTALQVVCLALQCSMRHYPMQPLSCTDMNRDVERKKNGKKAGENIRGSREEKQDRGWATATACRQLALGAQFRIFHRQFESQGRGSQGVDHVLVTLPAVLS